MDGMKVLVLGGGKMGLAIAHDLVKSGAEVQVGDLNEECMAVSETAEFVRVDASDIGQVEEAMRERMLS